MNIIPLLGILGALAFCFAAIPTAFATVRAGRSIGTPLSVITAILFGNILMYAYLFLQYGFNPILTFSYGIELLSWGVLLKFHIFPRAAK